MYIVPGVLAALVRKNKILLIKRAKKPYKGYWSMPSGKIEAGEHIEEAALRELKEETGIEAKLLGIRGIVSEILHKENGDKKAHYLMFICELSSSNENFVESKEGKLKWFKISELKKTKGIFPADSKMIKEFLLEEKKCLKVHKIRIRKKGTEYEMESFKC